MVPTPNLANEEQIMRSKSETVENSRECFSKRTFFETIENSRERFSVNKTLARGRSGTIFFVWRFSAKTFHMEGPHHFLQEICDSSGVPIS